MAIKKQPVKRNTATLVLEAEFEVDSADLATIMDDIRTAMEMLRGSGHVTKARLNIPETNVDLEDWY